MPINISDTLLQNAAEKGIAEAVRRELEGQYGPGAAIKAAVAKAIAGQESAIASAVTGAVAVACQSVEFRDAVARDLVKSLSSKFSGHFDGVVRAAAKLAANDAVVTARVAAALKDALPGDAE